MLRLAEKQIQLSFRQAQKEVDDLHQRTREGIETARLQGKQIGGVTGRKLNVKKAAAAKEVILKHRRIFTRMILPDTVLQKWRTETEGQFFDRKSARLAPKELASHISAFANASGGTIVTRGSPIQ